VFLFAGTMYKTYIHVIIISLSLPFLS